jgi:hypothetical protein
MIFEPLEFIARLAALVPKPPVPKPRVNLTPYHGVIAPYSEYRVLVSDIHQRRVVCCYRRYCRTTFRCLA